MALPCLWRAAAAASEALQPRFRDPELEARYARERRQRLLPLLRYTSLGYLFITLLWFFLPRDELPMRVWVFFRANGLFSSVVCIITVALMHRTPWWWRCYDVLSCLWGCHFVAFNSFTRRRAEVALGLQTTDAVHDEGFQLLVCVSWICGFFAYAELDLRYLLAIIHWAVGGWIALSATLGITIPAGQHMKLVLVYYILCLIIFEHARREEHSRRSRLHMQIELEKQAETDRATAQAERDGVQERVSAAEQAALYSFVAAVFDIFGYLEWKTLSDVDEPRLCFTSDTHAPALAQLLGRPVAGEPLDVLLGPMPSAPGPGKDMWHREQQRLWTYAVIEAGQPDDTQAESRPRLVARKMGLTCAGARQNKFEVELFLRPTTRGRALFGLRLLQTGAPEASPEEQHVRGGAGAEIYAGSFAGSVPCSRGPRSCQSSLSSLSGGSAPLPLEDSIGNTEEVSAWVDTVREGCPLIRCTVGFTQLAGPSPPMGVRLLDIVPNDPGFQSWLQGQVNAVAAGNDKGPWSRRVTLRPIGSARQFVYFKAQCVLDRRRLLDALKDLSDTDCAVLAPLTFRRITQHHLRRRKPRPQGSSSAGLALVSI